MLKISIIVPVYNTGKYLRECFDCIIAQTFTNFEVIAVDDGSTDDSGAICDEYAQKDNRFVVIHKKNGGVSAARNTGLDAATGDYIGFVDSDDTMLPGMLEEYATIAEKYEADFIECKGYIPEGEVCENRATPQVWVFDNTTARSEFFSIGKIRPSVCLAFIKKDILCDVRFPEGIHQWEDYAFIACAVAKSQKVAITSNRYYQYRYREGSATKRPLNDRQMSCILIDSFLKEKGVYKTEQERYDVVGFFTRCCSLNYLENTPEDKGKYKGYIKSHIRENKKALRKSRAVPFRERIIVLCFLISEPLSRFLYKIQKVTIPVLLRIRNTVRRIMNK